ncbi:MAG: 2-isopropylmalate synthase [Candidatus Brocadiia bacterium]|jgi:isopropylmalate/homocitrate/citramalate synthase
MSKIKEVSAPVLLADVFPHTMPPHIVFDDPIHAELDGKSYVIHPADLKARDIRITDTTFRDGQQARPPYTVKQILELFDLISRLSGPRGVIRQTEFFLYSAKDQEAVQKCLDRGYRYPEITGWIRADPGDLGLVRKMGLKETGLLTSCSDYHIFMKLRLDRRKALDRYTGIVKAALDQGIRPRCHLEDVTRADIEGFVIPYVEELMRISEQVEDSLKVKIRLCDTMGFGVSYPGAALPRSVPKLVLAMIHKAGVPGDQLEWHGHNDFHKALINGATAWLYGCDALNCTLIGIGERTGNPPLEGALMEYIGLKGDMCGIDTTIITEIAQFYRSIGTRISVRYPFVGDDFHKTRAGIHADGLARDERIYNIFDTEKLLKRPPEIVITDKSGADGVYLWVNNFLGLVGEERIKKTHIVKIMRWVADQYEKEGRITNISDREMAEQVREHLPAQYEKAQKAGRFQYTHHEE